MTVLNPIQCHKSFEDRLTLLEILNTPDIGKALPLRQVEFIQANSHLLLGSSIQWEELRASVVSKVCPAEGGLLCEAAITPLPIIFGRLLLDCKIDMETSWHFSMDGRICEWNLWNWASSIMLDDGIIDRDLMRSGWEVLLPVMIAAGFDLDRPCGVYSVAHLSRLQWLQAQDVASLEKAQIVSQAIILSRNTKNTTLNIVSRRI